MENYNVLGKIGAGAEGVVFRVEHVPTKKMLAMKVVRCCHNSKVNSALKEIKVLLQLHHQHVVSYFDFFLLFYDDKIRDEFAATNEDDLQAFNANESNWLYSTCGINNDHQLYKRWDKCLNSFFTHPSEICVCLVMELCTSGDMQSTINDAKQRFMETGLHPFSETQILLWMSQCTSALAFIHAQGFLHRDVKPTNIFFDDNKNVKIGDFGLAATVAVGCQCIVGTPLYIAPECILCQVYDEKVDVWGLGVVMLELVTLRAQPINSMVLENPLVVETVVQQVTSMGFTAKLGVLLRDMLQRFPEDRPFPSDIYCRLAVMSRVSPSCSFLSKDISGISSVGANSHEEKKVTLLACSTSAAAAAFCAGCVCSCHGQSNCKNHSFTQSGDQRRVQTGNVKELNNIDYNALQSAMCKAISETDISNNNGSNGQTLSWFAQPSYYSGEVSICDILSKHTIYSTFYRVKGIAVRVPQDYENITAALDAVCRLPHVRIIFVAGGTVHNTPLSLTDALPDGVRLVGETPSPVIEVGGDLSAISCVSGCGAVDNFIIRYVGRKVLQTNARSDTRTQKRSSRFAAISITGGEWKFTHCSVSCPDGNAIIVASARETVVSHCMIVDVKIAGVVLVEGSHGLFENNTLRNCGFAAFLLRKNSIGRLFRNRVIENKQTGVFVQEASGMVENNLISNNGGCGVVVRGASAADIIFRANKVVANEQAGLFCAGGATPIVLENEIRQNKSAGILIKSQALPRVMKNIIGCGNETGIYVFGGGGGFIEENRVEKNRNAGILVTSDGCPHVVKNTIRENIYEGVWICKGGGGTFFDNDLRGNIKGPKDIEKSDCKHVVWVRNCEA